MKILLMNPASLTKEQRFCDIGLGYLASEMRNSGHDIKLVLKSFKDKELRSLFKQEKPDILGMKILTTNVPEAIRVIRLVRTAIDTVIVLGGPHVSGDPLGVLQYVPADYAFQGEADKSLPQFANILKAGRDALQLYALPGFIYRKGDMIVANPPDKIDNLDEIPFPAWDLMEPRKYSSLVCKSRPAVSLLTTRGCTNICFFCAESNKKLRFRSIENVLAEIKYLSEEFNVREIQFLDSNFIAKKEHIKELCRRILENKINLAFCAPNGSRLEAVDEEVCSLLSRIGFYRINIGIESGSGDVLRSIGKSSNLLQISQKIALFRKYGIQVIGNFMLGFPGETRQQMQNTLNLALSLDLTGVNFSIYTPMPGTKLYNDLIRQDKLTTPVDFKNHNYVTYENHLSALSPRELRRFRNKCFFKFLMRIRTIKIFYELFKDGILWNNLIQRIYWMYVAKFLRFHTNNKF